jgi:hypothetical protein
MKKLIMIAIAALTLASNAQAMSPVPAPENGLVQLRIGGGFPFPGSLRRRLITITNDGVVHVAEAWQSKDPQAPFTDGETRDYVLGQVSAPDLIELKKAAASIQSRGLTKAKGPQCMDAPIISYLLAKGGVLVNAYVISDCRHQQLKKKSERPAALAIKAYLDQWNKLAQEKQSE